MAARPTACNGYVCPTLTAIGCVCGVLSVTDTVKFAPFGNGVTIATGTTEIAGTPLPTTFDAPLTSSKGLKFCKRLEYCVDVCYGRQMATKMTTNDKSSKPARHEATSQFAVFRTNDEAKIRAMILGRRVPAKRALTQIRSLFDVRDQDLADLLEISSRTVARRIHSVEDRLSVPEADRAYRLTRLFDLAAKMLGGNTQAKRWFHERVPAFGNECAVQLIRTEIGAYYVERALYAIGYGGLG